uniref:Uncharacterized protein n=1 Tax=Sphaerodactylus townsendi TaxID=933632 RepID=A0ACB8FB65_9SAUR
MKSAVVLLAGLCAFTAYYVYLPLPSTVSEPWRLLLLDASFRVAQQTVEMSPPVLPPVKIIPSSALSGLRCSASVLNGHERFGDRDMQQ